MIRLPDFIIAGAPRAGTTWLSEMLETHPDIEMARPGVPEPKFFLVDSEFAKGPTYYAERWFASLSAPVLGEKTSYYLEDPRVAERIAETLPAVKLIFLLREPAARAYSNYLRSRHNGFETLSFEAALDAEAERLATVPEPLRFVRPFAYFQRGLYARNLKPYLDLFSRERILILRTEDIAECSGPLAARVHDFLGVAPRPGDGEALGVVNAQESGAEQAPNAVMAALHARYAPEMAALEELIGQRFWPARQT